MDANRITTARPADSLLGLVRLLGLAANLVLFCLPLGTVSAGPPDVRLSWVGPGGSDPVEERFLGLPTAGLGGSPYINEYNVLKIELLNVPNPPTHSCHIIPDHPIKLLFAGQEVRVAALTGLAGFQSGTRFFAPHLQCAWAPNVRLQIEWVDGQGAVTVRTYAVPAVDPWNKIKLRYHLSGSAIELNAAWREDGASPPSTADAEQLELFVDGAPVAVGAGYPVSGTDYLSYGYNKKWTNPPGRHSVQLFYRVSRPDTLSPAPGQTPVSLGWLTVASPVLYLVPELTGTLTVYPLEIGGKMIVWRLEPDTSATGIQKRVRLLKGADVVNDWATIPGDQLVVRSNELLVSTEYKLEIETISTPAITGEATATTLDEAPPGEGSLRTVFDAAAEKRATEQAGILSEIRDELKRLNGGSSESGAGEAPPTRPDLQERLKNTDRYKNKYRDKFGSGMSMEALSGGTADFSITIGSDTLVLGPIFSALGVGMQAPVWTATMHPFGTPEWRAAHDVNRVAWIPLMKLVYTVGFVFACIRCAWEWK
jgi:hypothetical protein